MGTPYKKFKAEPNPVKVSDQFNYFILPLDPFSKITDRRRFEYVNDTLFMMDRDVTKKLEIKIEIHMQNHCLYVKGPQGVGKSHSLYQSVITLRQNSSYRVIYIPDCQSWGNSPDPYDYEFKVQVIFFSFFIKDDNYVYDYWKNKYLNRDSFTQFLEDLGEYCNQKFLSIFFIFDQHNGISIEQRSSYPFSIAERYLVTNFPANSRMVIISASANNKYYLKVVKDDEWPRFTMDSGFTDTEFNHWAAYHSFDYPNMLELIKTWTDLIPLELKKILDIWKENPGIALIDLLNIYKTNRLDQIRIYDDEFRSTNQTSFKQIVNGVLYMKLKIPVQDRLYRINELIMLSTDARGRIVEHYLIERIEKDRKFVSPVSPIDYKTDNCTCVWDTNRLIVPDSPNFLHLDWIIWDYSKKYLYVFQVTLGASHSYNWNESKWKKKSGATKVFFIWVATSKLTINHSLDGQYLVYIQNLSAEGQFPLSESLMNLINKKDPMPNEYKEKLISRYSNKLGFPMKPNVLPYRRLCFNQKRTEQLLHMVESDVREIMTVLLRTLDKCIPSIASFKELYSIDF
eukprot:gene3128-3910_t